MGFFNFSSDEVSLSDRGFLISVAKEDKEEKKFGIWFWDSKFLGLEIFGSNGKTSLCPKLFSYWNQMAVLAIETENNTVCVYAKIKGRKKEERKEERRKKEVFEKRKKIKKNFGIFSLPALPALHIAEEGRRSKPTA